RRTDDRSNHSTQRTQRPQSECSGIPSSVHSVSSVLKTFSVLRPPFSVLRPPFSVLRPPSSVLRSPSSVLRSPMTFARRELALLGAIVLLFSLPLLGVDGFYRVSTFRNLIIDNLPLLLAAAGMTVVIIAGQIDISIGSNLVVSGVVAGLTASAGCSMPIVVLATLAAGSAFGAVNGLLVTR